MAELEPAVDPFTKYTISTSGFITVYFEGEDNTCRVVFKNPDLLVSAWLGLKDAAHTQELYETVGPEEAWAYVEEGAANTTLTDDDLTALLDEGGT